MILKTIKPCPICRNKTPKLFFTIRSFMVHCKCGLALHGKNIVKYGSKASSEKKLKHRKLIVAKWNRMTRE